MNAPALHNAQAATPPDAARLSRAFVHAGIAEFARLSLGAPSAVFDALAASQAGDELATLLGTPRDDWHAACLALARTAPELRGPLGRLLADLKLQLHEWFALALCGENESSHLLNLALAELQAPGALRPGLHLVTAASAALFGASLAPLALPNHRLVRAGVLDIVGDGPLRAAIESKARSLHMADRLVLTGFRQDIPQLIRTFDVFALSSSEEGMCSTLLEVAACGLPIVAADAGGVREAVLPDVTGLIVPIRSPRRLAQGILKLANHPDIARELAERGRRRVLRDFTIERLTDRTLAVYDRVLRGRVGPRHPAGYLAD